MLQPAVSGLSTVSQCAVHLELLEAFTWLHNWVYKEEASSEIFGEDPEKNLWRSVVKVAVARFGIWWEVVNKELKAREEAEAGVLNNGNSTKVLPRDLLQPLDVLMVWHSYMLNPRRYNEDCIWFGMSGMMNLAFPYEHIVCCTCCPTHLKYSRLMVSSMKLLTTINGIINSLDMPRGTGRGSPLKPLTFSRKSPPKKLIKCPACAKEIDVFICEIEPENRKRGWISEEFAVDCEGCGMGITMESLCAEKFRKISNH